jgi:dihydropyrimidinase
VSHHLLRSMSVERGQGAESHAKAHPAWTEGEGIRRVAQMVGASGAQVLVSTVSSQEGLDALQWAKSKFPSITAATSPIHLTVGRDHLEREDASLWTVHPPLRGREAHRPLWQALDSGLVDAVTSLHRALPREDKVAGRDDPVKVEPGWAGIETVLPMLWSDGVEKRRLTAQALVSVMSETPAKLFGLWPHKGSLDIGADADLVLFDPEKIEDVSAEQLHMGVDYHPMNGRTLKGWPVSTILRGQVIARGGEFVGEPEGGRLAPRQFGLG